MNEMFAKGYAEEVQLEDIDIRPRWYVPHHAVSPVDKPNKFRVVFDCSANYNGYSLNQNLLKGPDLANSLTGLLIRFREELVAISCDVKKMFYQVRVPQEDCPMLRFLWWKNSDMEKDPTEFQMRVHPFGASSSPSVVNYVLKAAAAAERNEDNSKAADFICRDFYVDDGLKSVGSVDEAVKLIRDSKMICSKSGFTLHKFASNEVSSLVELGESELAESAKNVRVFDNGVKMERALGVEWRMDLDCFQFSIQFRDCPLTRRGLLATTYSIFDPIGLLSPVVVVAKRILQDLCRNRFNWDEPLPDDIRARWTRWRQDLLLLQGLKIPRCYKPPGFGEVVCREYHHFSDASTIGLGQCTYLRQLNRDGDVCCALVVAKARVAPLKSVTVPRLELMAAVNSVNVAEFVKRETCIGSHFYWSDSQVVLGYIRNDSSRFHVFVANRVQQIRDVSEPRQWGYVRSAENPADLASRGMSVANLIDNHLWWKGPSFLVEPFFQFEASSSAPCLSENDPEVKVVNVNSVSCDTTFFMDQRLQRFSSLYKAKIAVSLCIRLQNRVRNSGKSASYVHQLVPVTVPEMMTAEIEIIRLCQRQYYAELYHILLKGGGQVWSKFNQLYRLDPILDENGLIRVGGRINRSPLIEHNVKHPVIVPKGSRLAELIIDECHKCVHHQGRGMTLGEIRSRGYWLVNASSSVTNFIRKCVTCRRLREVPLVQKMSSLPEDRLSCEAPFTYCGVDTFGPWYVKGGRSELKRYGILFTCMSSRAVHIEMVKDIATDAFINAYRRFVARRGPVRQMRSDRGTNFVGAVNELNGDRLCRFLREDGCEWIFNPPHASHMGGVWERQIRSVRSIMNQILLCHGRRLDDECLHTFLVETEGIINRRPLCVEDLNSECPEPLTPNHLLTCKSKVFMPPPAEFQSADKYAKKRWRRVQFLLDEFWSRWNKTYLQNLQVRQKWLKASDNLNEGDVVLVKDSNVPRNDWCLARVVNTYPGPDGHVRKVTIAKGDRCLGSRGERLRKLTLMDRPINQLILLIRNV